MKAFELTEEQRNDLYFKNFDGTIKIDGFVFSDYKGNTTMRISNTQEERPTPYRANHRRTCKIYQ